MSISEKLGIKIWASFFLAYIMMLTVISILLGLNQISPNTFIGAVLIGAVVVLVLAGIIQIWSKKESESG